MLLKAVVIQGVPRKSNFRTEQRYAAADTCSTGDRFGISTDQLSNTIFFSCFQIFRDIKIGKVDFVLHI